jgi:hypothetical protein
LPQWSEIISNLGVSRANIQLRKSLIFMHRWLGVGLCLLFLLWFASGAILMYWDYPSVSTTDRLNKEPALDASLILLSPQEAYGRLQIPEPPDEARLAMFDGRPVYRFVLGGDQWMVSAENGQNLAEFPPQQTLRIATAWTGQSPTDSKEEDNTEEDQWTVAEEFQVLRPMRKYSWPDGEEVYVSTVTGDIVQYTTRASRLGAYLGAIPHWLYFTPLRKHGQRWSQIVILTSGVGTLAALLGIVIGVWVYSPANYFRNGGRVSSIPYRGWKRWHLILGLIFGPLACTWVLSGMLSMDPFPKLQSGNSNRDEARFAEGLRGVPIPLSAFDAKPPGEVIRQLGPNLEVKELELTSFAGEPYYLATTAALQTRVVPLRGKPAPEFDRSKIIEALRTAALPSGLTETRVVTEYESYYLDRHNRLPLPVLFVQLNDSGHSTIYVDPRTARIVRRYNYHSRWNRWLYHGLHSIDLPWLYKLRPAWDILVLILLFGGAALSLTSLLLAWRVLCGKVAAILDNRSA